MNTCHSGLKYSLFYFTSLRVYTTVQFYESKKIRKKSSRFKCPFEGSYSLAGFYNIKIDANTALNFFTSKSPAFSLIKTRQFFINECS